MVSKKKSERWPPAGWKVEIKVSNGRNFKCYTHSRTGKKFYSKVAVLRYIKAGSADIGGSRARQGHAKKNSSKKQMHLVEDNDSVDLPPGWTVELRTRKSGARKGTKYKCFTDPSTGSKFFSKPEVYRYLESIKGSAGSSGRKERGHVRHSSSKKSVDPVIPHKAKLEPSVSQNSNTREQKRLSSVERKVVIERTEDEDLPSGWVKEMRIKMKGNELVRRDPFYFDSASGLVFRSKLEVLRYIETGEISRHAYRRKSGSINSDEVEIEKQPPTSSGKRGKTRSRTRKQLFADEESPKQSISVLPESECIEKQRGNRTKGSASRVRPAAVDEAGFEQNALILESVSMAHEVLPAKPLVENVSAPEETEGVPREALPVVQAINGKGREATLEQREPSSASSEDILGEDKPEDAVLRGCSNGKSQTSKKKTKDRNPPGLPFRSSKRLAGVDAEVVFHSIPIEHTRKRKSSKAKANPTLGSIPIVSQEETRLLDVDLQNVLASQGENPRSLEADTQIVLAAEGESLNKNDSFTEGTAKEVALPEERTPPDVSHNLETLVNIDQSMEDPTDTLPGGELEKSPGEHQTPEVQADAQAGSNIDKPVGERLNVEEQPGTVERDTEQPGSQFCFPSPLWSDPCLEFAFKTLTGAIPLDDNLAIEDYIQHQLRTSSQQTCNDKGLPDMGVPSCFQNDETKPVSPLPEDVSFSNSNGFGSQKSNR